LNLQARLRARGFEPRASAVSATGAALPVEASNLGLRGQSAASMPPGPTGIEGRQQAAPGPGLEPGLADPKAAVLPTTPTGIRWCGALTRIRTWTGRVLSALPLPLGYKGRHPRWGDVGSLSRDSNPVPPVYETGARPVELDRHVRGGRVRLRGVEPRLAWLSTRCLCRLGYNRLVAPRGSGGGGSRTPCATKTPGLQPGGAPTAPSPPRNGSGHEYRCGRTRARPWPHEVAAGERWKCLLHCVDINQHHRPTENRQR
jgi:hypothetical protein